MASSLPDAVVEKIKSNLELFPGLLATSDKLAALLKYVREERCLVLGGGTAANPKHTVTIGAVQTSDGFHLHVNVKAPKAQSGEPPLFMAEYQFTPDGLLRALVDAKERIADHLKRGGCPDCEAQEPPKKRARALGMPKCCACVIATTLGL